MDPIDIMFLDAVCRRIKNILNPTSAEIIEVLTVIYALDPIEGRIPDYLDPLKVEKFRGGLAKLRASIEHD
jgi:hypothetical protein